MENVLHVHKSLKNFKTESVFQQSIIVGQDNIFKMEYVLTLIPFVKFTKESVENAKAVSLDINLMPIKIVLWLTANKVTLQMIMEIVSKFHNFVLPMIFEEDV